MSAPRSDSASAGRDPALRGRSVVVTRAPEQAGVLAGELESLGAEVVLAPTIAFDAPSDGGAALTRCAEALCAADAAGRGGTWRPDWIVFTSDNAVRYFTAALTQAARGVPATDGSGGAPVPRRTPAELLAGTRIAVVGPGTSAAALDAGFQVDLVPDRFVAEGLLEAFGEAPGDGATVLIPRAEVAREVLPVGLRERGFTVEVVPAYRTVRAQVAGSSRAAVAAADAVLFASSSSVDAFVELYGIDSVPPVIGAIGPVTAARVGDHGLEVALQPDQHTIAGLVEALAAHLGPAD